MENQYNSSCLTVSVCVMTYNLENYIAEALDSILMQKTSFRYDIVVGDDGSSDGTRDILNEYASRNPTRISLLFHDKNIGMLANFVETLKACKGKYLAILDGDDYWTDPLKLQKQVDFLETHKEYSMVFHNAELHDYTGNSLSSRPFSTLQSSREYTANEIMESWIVTTCSVLCINKEQYRYIESNIWFPVQDLPFYLCCARFGKIFYLADTMCVYRRLPTGSQHSEEFKSVEIHRRFIEYYKVLYSDFDDMISAITFNRVSAMHYLFAANKSLQNGIEIDFQRFTSLALTYDPDYVHETSIQNNQHRISSIAINKLKRRNKNQDNTRDEERERTKLLKSNYSLLLNLISDVTQFNLFLFPLKKFFAYRKLIKTFYILQRKS